MKCSLAVVSFALVIAALPVAAQSPRRGLRSDVPPYMVLEKLNRMTPEERESVLGRIPSSRRALVEERLRKYREMPEPAKKRLRDEYNLFQQLPPEKQDDMRRLFRQLEEFPDDRRRAVRKEIVRLRNMPPERRSHHMASPRFKEEFSDKEREFLSSLTNIFPSASSDPVEP